MKTKKYEKIIVNSLIPFLILFLIFLLIKHFIPIIEGATITDKEKEMIYDQQADVNNIKTKQSNLVAEMTAINNEIKTSNDLFEREKQAVEETLKKAEKKAETTGLND